MVTQFRKVKTKRKAIHMGLGISQTKMTVCNLLCTIYSEQFTVCNLLCTIYHGNSYHSHVPYSAYVLVNAK